jgi:hypothetical protein
VVKIKYSSEKGVTNLAQMTFQVQNTLSEPGAVLTDYLTATRYGAGVDLAQIDTTSIANLTSFANEIPPNQKNSDGSTSTQARYIVNGVISTGETVKNNLGKITQSCGTWLTYDFSQGKWKAVLNRQLSSGELAACTVFDDDSIIGEISINATNLEDLYNSIEVEFPNRDIRDQNDYYRASIDPSYRNDLEPDNTLTLRYDLVNNSIHAQRLGLMELEQSRVDKTIQFKTDFSGLQVQAGDVIKITNEVYNFTEKLFRVTRVREVENSDGGLYAEITGLEYDAIIYADTAITAYAPISATGIPSFDSPVALPAPGTVSVTAAAPSNNQPNFNVSVAIGATSAPVDQIQWYYQTGSNYVYITNEVGPFAAGSTVNDTIYGLPAGSYNLYARAVRSGNFSAYSTTGTTLVWNPQPGGVNNGVINTSTYSSQVNIQNTASGVFNIALTTGTGYQTVFQDTDLVYNAASNVLTVGGSVTNKTVTSGGYPLNSTGTATVGTFANYPSMVVSNYTAGLTPQIMVRAYGQNRPGGVSTTPGNGILIFESARGTSSAPTAVGSGDSIGAISAGGYDGTNWTFDSQGTATTVLGFYASETWISSSTGVTRAAGSGIQAILQPQWTQPVYNGVQSRQRIIYSTWTTSTTAPPILALGIGSGVDGSAPTIASSDYTTSTVYTGYGRANIGLTNSLVSVQGVPSTDTAPDNSSLTNTNVIQLVSSRRSGATGRRNQVQINDSLGGILWRSQSGNNQTGAGNINASITGLALDTQTAGAQGARLTVQTVNTATATLSTRMSIDDRQISLAADTHKFTEKTGSFTALTVTTATATFTAIPVMPVKTAAQWNAITGAVGQQVCVSDSASGSNPNGMLAFWDTTNNRWSYIHDNSAV